MTDPAIHQEAIRATKDAITLLKQPGRWTQGTNAKNEFGTSVPPTSNDASCFCLNGALVKNIKYGFNDVSFLAVHDEIWNALERVGYHDPVGFNDVAGRTQEEIVVLEQTLAELEKAA